MQPNVAIIGASGYSGAELMRILSQHRCVNLKNVFANTSAGKRVDELYPIFRGRVNLSFEQYSAEAMDGIDLVFVALPSGEAMNIVPTLLKKGKRVIDLGGDFRLKEPAVYGKYYKRNHVAVEYLSESVYGLPEINRERIAKANLIANPGCYPTGAILALAPVLKQKIVSPSRIVINALSGVSGAGRSASLELSFVEANENARAYKVGVHQHTPEIKAALEQLIGNAVSLTFVPHLVPISRGIYTTIYADLQDGSTENDITNVFESFYANAPFVRIMRSGIPEVRDVANTNYCDIAARVDADNQRLIIMSVIDNLVKGAAGQAVQNMNLMFGFSEEEGLLP